MQVILIADDGATGDEFGASLHIGGGSDPSISRIAVGAPEKGAGAVYLFELNSGDTVPSWTQVKKLTPADGIAGERFGASVYSNRLNLGEFTIVGAPNDDDLGADSGSVYVYNFVGANTWNLESKLNASDGAAGHHFGQSMISIFSGGAGLVTIVGAPDADNGATLDTGAVYTFKRSDVPSWSQEAKLNSGDADTGDHFGADVDAYLDYNAVIGAPGDDEKAIDAGAAYVFDYAGFGYTWTQRKKLMGANSLSGDAYGSSVATEDEIPGYALIGSALENAEGAQSGTVYAYIESDASFPNTSWIQIGKLLANNTMTNDHFGSSFAIDGNYAVVGANNDADGGAIGNDTNAGAAYIFFKSAGVWNQQARFTAGDGGRATQFGTSVAISGDTVLISAPGANAVHAYVRNDTLWTRQAVLTSDNPPGSGFGARLALDGDTAAIAGDGNLYFFKRSGSTWSLQNKFVGGGPIAIDGNWTVIGSNGYGTGGGAHLYRWNGSNWAFVTTLVPPNNDSFSTNQSFGSAVDISGTTIAVSAYRFDHVTNEVGAVYVFTYDGTNWVFQQRIQRSNPLQFDRFGFSLSLENDRIAVGMPDAFNFSESAFVFRKIAPTWTQVQSLVPIPNTNSDNYGQNVVLENGELWITAPTKTISGANGAGTVYVYDYTPDADLTIELTDRPGVIAGFDLPYEITVTNNGQENATGVSVVDTLPANVAFVGATAGCTPAANIVTCAIGTLNIGASATVEIDVTVNGAATGVLNNQATVSSALPDPNTADNTATQQTQIVPAPGVPTPISPTSGSITTNTLPTFTWSAVAGITNYEVQLDIIDPPIGTYTGFNVGTTFKPPAPLLYATYYWRVRSVDDLDVPSPWSDTQILIVNAPDTVAPIRNVSNAAQPILSWTPVTWATGYEVEIGADKNFATASFSSGTLAPTESSYTSLYELPNGTWYWRVRALKADGVTWSAWSVPETIQVVVQ